MKKRFWNINDSIAAQLLKMVFSFYFILTAATTLIHMSAEFFSKKAQVTHELKIIGDTFAPVLAQALWDMNEGQLQPTFLGMVQFPAEIYLS